MSVVLDASALLELWLSPSADELAVRLKGETLHAPVHIRIEASNVLRRQRSTGILHEDDAQPAFEGIMTAPLRLWPFEVLAVRSWELGNNMTSYDAAYVALAEKLGVPLITHDRKLALTPGVNCNIEAF